MLQLNVIGGSVSQAFGLEGDRVDWPSKLGERIVGEGEISRVSSVGFLNPASLLKYIEQANQCDVLIIHMGTSVGWPVIRAPLEKFLRPENRHDAAFHLPTTRTISIRHALKRVLRHALRNLLKFCAFPFGLYRPRQSLRTLDADLEQAIARALLVSDHVIWIQHRSLGYRRLFLERWVYQRYFNRIQASMHQKAKKISRLHLIDIPDHFLNQKNFTLDGVHISAEGHRELSDLIEKSLRSNGLLPESDVFTRFSQETA